VEKTAEGLERALANARHETATTVSDHFADAIGELRDVPRHRRLVEKIRALPAVARRRRQIESALTEVRGTIATEESAREKQIEAFARAVEAEFRERGERLTVQNRDELALERYEASPAGERIEAARGEANARFAELTASRDALDDRIDYFQPPSPYAGLVRLPARKRDRLDDAERAIVDYFDANPCDRAFLFADEELRENYHRAIAFGEALFEKEEALRERGPERTKALTALRDVFAPGATTEVAFAVGFARRPSGGFYPSVLVPLRGTPRISGLGIPVTAFEVTEGTDAKKAAKASVANLLEKPVVDPVPILYCKKP
jgi:hypothetical protein